MSIQNEERNRELVGKRLDNPERWSWRELGFFYAIHWTRAKQIFDQNFPKYANKQKIDRYYKMMSKYGVESNPQLANLQA